MHLEEGGFKGAIRFGNWEVTESLQVKCDRFKHSGLQLLLSKSSVKWKGKKIRSTEKMHKHARIAWDEVITAT